VSQQKKKKERERNFNGRIDKTSPNRIGVYPLVVSFGAEFAERQQKRLAKKKSALGRGGKKVVFRFPILSLSLDEGFVHKREREKIKRPPRGTNNDKGRG